MKDRMPLKKLLAILPESIKAKLVELELPEDTPAVRKRAARPVEELAEGERAAIQYVSTRDIDRDREILDPKGAILDEFKMAPQVLWGHDYSQPPVGSDEWIVADDYGLKAKTVYATTDRGEEVWTLKKEGHLKTSSVGFIPVEWVHNDDSKDWKETVRGYAEKWGLRPSAFKDVWRIYTKWILLEHSEVSVPANPHALTLEVAKGLGLSERTIKELGIDEVEPEPEPEPAREPVTVTPLKREVRRIVHVRHVPRVVPAPLDVPAIVANEILRARGKV